MEAMIDSDEHGTQIYNLFEFLESAKYSIVVASSSYIFGGIHNQDLHVCCNRIFHWKCMHFKSGMPSILLAVSSRIEQLRIFRMPWKILAIVSVSSIFMQFPRTKRYLLEWGFKVRSQYSLDIERNRRRWRCFRVHYERYNAWPQFMYGFAKSSQQMHFDYIRR